MVLLANQRSQQANCGQRLELVQRAHHTWPHFLTNAMSHLQEACLQASVNPAGHNTGIVKGNSRLVGPSGHYPDLDVFRHKVAKATSCTKS